MAGNGKAAANFSAAAVTSHRELQAGFDHLTVAFERLKAWRGRITISVTVPPAFADKWLLPRVERFATNHPLYDLRIDTSGRLVDFAAERMDVGIRYGGGAGQGSNLPSCCVTRFFLYAVQPCSRGQGRCEAWRI
jgi:LysR family transcriptional regulator, glycine cleavage system transcriptional activator